MLNSTAHSVRAFTLNMADTIGHTVLGYLGETLAGFMLMSLGLFTSFHPVGQHYDIKATNYHTGQIWRIEVKTARLNNRNRWQFCLAKTGHTDHLEADVIALLCVTSTGNVIPYFVPTTVLANNRQVTISPNNAEHKLSQYKFNFTVFD